MPLSALEAARAVPTTEIPMAADHVPRLATISCDATTEPHQSEEGRHSKLPGAPDGFPFAL